MKILKIGAFATFMVLSASYGGAVCAADLNVLSSSALAEVLNELTPKFERTSGQKVVTQFESSTGVKRMVEAGTGFDVAIVTPRMIDELSQQGKIVPGSATEVARTGYGVAIRSGAAKPDISTVAAFRQTLLDAKSITYNKDGQSGIHMAAVIARLGIADQMRGRTILKLVAGPVAEDVANGAAELGFQAISEILPVKGVELLGPLPGELQAYTVLTAGVATASANPTAAQSFVDFLRSPSAARVMAKRGLETSKR
jgi:molybdate transport system substrate-binding protein